MPGVATPITYELDGKQYIAVMSGVSKGRVFGFALDAKETMPNNPPEGGHSARTLSPGGASALPRWSTCSRFHHARRLAISFSNPNSVGL